MSDDKKPAIRFKNYSDDWEQRKLGELGSLKNGMNFSKEAMGIGFPFVNLQNIFGNNVIDVTNLGKAMASDSQLKDYNLLNGDVLFVRSSLKLEGVGEAALVPQNLENTTYSGFIIRFRDEYGLDNNFKRFIFGIESVRNQIMAQATNSANKNISQTVLENLCLKIPNKSEQEKIGLYFSNLDKLITLHHRKYDKLQNLKKAMLEKMFPKNGSNVPEIRFKGFTDDWEQRKFGEITELKSASRVHKDEWTSNGVPFYRSSDVMAAINGTENEKVFISEELYEKLSKVSGKLEEGDILVTGGGSVGNPYIVPDNKPLYTKDADLLWIKNKGKFHSYFLYEFFFSPTFRNYLGSISHVGTIAHYTITQLSDTPICLPSFEEQKKVGEYFQSLDNLITLHQRELEKLKNVKKAMLEKMFV